MKKTHEIRNVMQVARTNQSGFTLIELMVCVAIVGVLASIVTAEVGKYRAKARSTEAKIALAAIYTAEQSYAAESGSYTACLANTGFTEDAAMRFFRVGFSSTQAAQSDCGPNGDKPCSSVDWPLGAGVGSPCTVDVNMLAAEPYVYPATALMPNAPSLPTDAQMPQSLPLSNNSFVASAVNNSTDILADGDQPSKIHWMDLLESPVYADDGASGDGSDGGGGNSGSGSGSNPPGPSLLPPPPTCTNPSSAWIINSERTLVLTQICPGE